MTQERQPQKPKKYLKLKDIVSDYSIAKSSVAYLIKTQNFPENIKISPRSVVWERAAVDSWFNQRKEKGVQV